MINFEKLKRIAKAKGYSLITLNQVAGLGDGTIYNWKKNKPTAENLNKVTQILHVSVNDLIDKENEDNNIHPSIYNLNSSEILNAQQLAINHHTLSKHDTILFKSIFKAFISSQK